MERFYDVDLERDVADDLEMRIEEGDDVRSLALEVGKRRWECDALADDFRPKRGEEVEFDGERVEGFDLEGEDFPLVLKREDDAVGDGARVGFRRHDELQRWVLATACLLVQSHRGRER